MSDFLVMGGYAAFVWPAYAISALALGGMAALTLKSYFRAKAQLRELPRRGA
jgi:heme exporter protein D